MDTAKKADRHPHAELIDSLGGSAALARKLGFKMPHGTQRVNNWKARGIPPRVRLDHPAAFRAASLRTRKKSI